MIIKNEKIERVEDCGNGFGWSIIRFENDDLYSSDYELAVLKNGELCYETSVTIDVERGDFERMEQLKQQIRELRN